MNENESIFFAATTTENAKSLCGIKYRFRKRIFFEIELIDELKKKCLSGRANNKYHHTILLKFSENIAGIGAIYVCKIEKVD